MNAQRRKEIQAVLELDYIWVNVGLNRHERRAREAFIRAHRKDNTERVKWQVYTAKAELRESTPNIPARRNDYRAVTNNPIYAAYAGQRGVKVVQR